MGTRAIKGRTTVQTTVTVPIKLREKMDKFQKQQYTNWSKIATEAWARYICEHSASRKENDEESPHARAANRGGIARGARDAEGRTDKDKYFELWLEAAKHGEHLDFNAVVDLFPNRSPNTLRTWRSKFDDCGRGTRNRAYPRIAHGRAKEIIEALRNLFGANSLSADDIDQVRAATTPVR